EFLGLPVVAIPSFSVIVGNGQTITCDGFCEAVPVTLANQVFHIPFFILPIHGADLVLGVQWLQTLGSFLSDYSVPSIQFTYNNKPITLTGKSPVSPTLATYSQFCRFLFTDAIVSAHTIIVAAVDTTKASPPKLNPPQHPAVTSLLHRYDTVFTKPQTLPPHRTHNHHIHLLPNSKPVNIRPYRYPQYQKEVMTTMIREMLADGVIRPSTSLFSSPVLLVRKKDATWRFCVDYRTLNTITVKDRFPIPTIDELLDELHGAKVFSKLDLRSGYHQIRVAHEDCFKTVFRTVDGHFEFCVMPFGLSNTPSTFQATMNEVFSAFLRKFVLVFFDDILCEFTVEHIAYLGHIISPSGVEADPEKLQDIQAWPPPSSTSNLRGFLGLTGFYRRFVQHYATIASPLTDLLKQQAFSWSPAALTAFQALKTAMTTLSVLGIPNFSVMFDVTTDASGVAIGAVLSQQSHPIAYFSQKLCPRMCTASAYEREMYAITAAVKKWRHYLLGRHFRIFTDQQSLRNLLSQTIQTPAQHKWLSKLLRFDYEIHYTPGRANVVADALSRREDPPQAMLCAIAECQPLLLDTLRNFYASHPTGMVLAAKFQDTKHADSVFCFKQGLLFHKDRLFVPLETDLRKQLLTEFHTTPIGGHSGVKG
ncbi:enzymatic polyprotein, partial [Trifolium medium]|nr:enzymatic polyprotein [Trifolium medium]